MIAVYRGGPWHGRRERLDSLVPTMRVIRPGEVIDRPKYREASIFDLNREEKGPVVEYDRVRVPPLDVWYVLLDRCGDVGMYLCGDPSPEEMAAGWPLADLSPSKAEVKFGLNQPLDVELGDHMLLNGEQHVVSGIDFGGAGPTLTLAPAHLDARAPDMTAINPGQADIYRQFAAEMFRS